MNQFTKLIAAQLNLKEQAVEKATFEAKYENNSVFFPKKGV